MDMTMHGFRIVFVAAVLGAPCVVGAWRVPGDWEVRVTEQGAVREWTDKTWCGHVQGMCATSNALFFSFHNQVVKTDWKGRFLKRVEAVPHGGDICHWNGRVYVGAWEPPARKGTKGCTAIRVYDAETLEPVKERRMPEWQNAADGKFIYASYYTRDEAARAPNFIVFDRDFKVVGKHLFGWTHGMDVVPGGHDGAVRFANCITLNNNWDTKSPVVPQVAVQFGDLKDGKLTDITKYIGYSKPMKR